MDGPCCVDITLLHVGFEDLMPLACPFVLQLRLFWTTKAFPVSFYDTPLSLPGKLLGEKVCVCVSPFFSQQDLTATIRRPAHLSWKVGKVSGSSPGEPSHQQAYVRAASWKSLAVLPQRAQILGQGKHTPEKCVCDKSLQQLQIYSNLKPLYAPFLICSLARSCTNSHIYS